MVTNILTRSYLNQEELKYYWQIDVRNVAKQIINNVNLVSTV